jgi:undecaprenyl-phosphate 4-deoxy-4-formamido-L-arabinose transferase
MQSIIKNINQNNKPNCSIVVPVYNSEESLPFLAARLDQVLPEIANLFEVILVNDGSSDNSWNVILGLTSKYSWIHAINLMRNSGQHNALLCGIRAANYEITITLDDDLQQPPEEIHKLLAKFNEGYDVVYGSPNKLPHEFWRNFSSRFTKRIMAYVMGIPNVINIGPFRVFRTDLRKAFANYQSPNVIIDVLLSWATTKFAVTHVDEQPRMYGKSNYTFSKLASAAFLVLTGYSTVPLRFASMLGFAVTLFGVLVFLYVITRYILQGSLPGFPFLASIITIFSGAQLFTLGIIGEYIASIFNRSTDRPPYVINQEIGGSK